MHNAPAVSYPVGRSRLGGQLAAGLWLLGAVTQALWLLQAPAGWRQALGVACWLVVSAWAWLSWRAAPSGELAWDGSHWHWRGSPVDARVALDLQEVVLLRLSGGAGAPCPPWLCLERRGDTARWSAVRRAIYSPAKNAAAPLGESTQ